VPAEPLYAFVDRYRVMSTPARQAGAKLPSMGRARVIFGSLG